jgi:hypothetical protein
MRDLHYMLTGSLGANDGDIIRQLLVWITEADQIKLISASSREDQPKYIFQISLKAQG